MRVYITSECPRKGLFELISSVCNREQCLARAMRPKSVIFLHLPIERKRSSRQCWAMANMERSPKCLHDVKDRYWSCGCLEAKCSIASSRIWTHPEMLKWVKLGQLAEIAIKCSVCNWSQPLRWSVFRVWPLSEMRDIMTCGETLVSQSSKDTKFWGLMCANKKKFCK